MTGIAAGFGAVFGTPVAGAVFAMEVLTRGRLKYAAALPCLMAAVLADVVCARCWGIHHTRYSITTVTPADWHQLALLALRVTVAGALFGLASLFFEKLSHAIKHYANRYIPVKWLIPAVGGLVIIGLTWLLGTTDYLGLGVNSSQAGGVSIVNAFHEHGVTHWSWLWKLVFTAITLGMGFKGGEVTPLFFIGAAVGNTLAVYMGMPADLFAGLGFIAVFAGATNTPLACTLMGFELFGAGCGPWFAVACFAAFFCSGRGSIYSAQRHSSQPSAGK